MKLSQLLILEALVENDCSVTETAQKVGLAQSAISRQLQMLEEELGYPLVLRRGKRMLGTTDLYKKVEGDIDAIMQAQANIIRISQEHKNAATGTLRIGTTHTQARFFLPQAVVQFRKSFPNIRLVFEQSKPDRLVHMLYKNQIDLAICTDKLEVNDKVALYPCYRWVHMLLVPDDHPLTQKKERISIEDLARYPLITYAAFVTGGGRIQETFQKAGVDMDRAFTVTDSEIIKTYVQLGLGLGIIAGMACLTLTSQEKLSVLPIDHIFPESFTKIGAATNHFLPSYVV